MQGHLIARVGNVKFSFPWLGQMLLVMLCLCLCVLLHVKAAVKMLGKDLLVWVKQ